MKSLVCGEKNNQDALFHRELDAAERIRNTPDVLERNVTNSLSQRATQRNAVDGAQFEKFMLI
jgi:hypothetical protein